MRLTVLPLAAAGLFLAADASAQYETPVQTATPVATAAPVATATPEATPAPVATPAPEPEKKKAEVTTGATKLAVGGAVFASYGYVLGDAEGNPNAFDITRSYINIMPSFGETLDGRITYDIVRQGPGVTESGEAVTDNTTESLVARLKYAYLTNRFCEAFEMTFGAQPTPWLQNEEEMFGYRSIHRSPAEEFFGIATTDIGLGSKLRLFKRIEIQTNVQNGESYNKAEKNKYKEIASRATVTILPNDKGGLKAHGYYGISMKDQDADKVRAIGMISYQHSMFMAAAQYIMSQDGDGAGTHTNGKGASVFGYYNVPFAIPGTVGTRVIVRADMFDKDVDVDAADGDVELMRTIVGASVRLHEKAQFILSYQSYELAENKGGDASTLFAHVEMKF